MSINEIGFAHVQLGGLSQTEKANPTKDDTNDNSSNLHSGDVVSISSEGLAMSTTTFGSQGQSETKIGSMVEMLKNQYRQAQSAGDKAKILRQGKAMIDQDLTQKVGEGVRLNLAELEEAIDESVEEAVAKRQAEEKQAQKTAETARTQPSEQSTAEVTETSQGAAVAAASVAASNVSVPVDTSSAATSAPSSAKDRQEVNTVEKTASTDV